MYDSRSYKDSVCHDMSDVVMHSRESLKWLIHESFKVILKHNNVV